MISIMKMPLAWAYGRYSSDMQAEGDSHRRQTEKAMEYAKKNGLDLPPENMMFDEGLSGFTGDNIRRGQLGQFLKSVGEGKIPRGSYLLVEDLDRLSRLTARKAMRIVDDLMEAGINIVTMNNGMVYKDGDGSESNLFMQLVETIRGHSESARKSKVGRDNWAEKRKNAGREKLTKTCPKWMALLPDRSEYQHIPDRAPIVRRMVRMSIEGQGIYRICKAFNREGVRPFPPNTSWTVPTVRNILRSRALIGEYQPKMRIKGTKNQKELAGESIPNYYPAVISEADFHACQHAMNRRSKTGRGRKGNTFASLFSGVAFCAECGSKMYYNKQNGYQSSKILYCKGAKVGACKAKAWPYEAFEKSFLSFVNEVDVESIINGGTQSRSERIIAETSQIDGELEDIDRKVGKWTNIFENDDAGAASAIAVTRLKELQERKNFLQKRMTSLMQEQRGIEDTRSASKRPLFTGFPDDLPDEERYQLRAKASEHIKSVVESVHLVAKNPRFVDWSAKGLPLEAWNNFNAQWAKAAVKRPMYWVMFRGGGAKIVFTHTDDKWHMLDFNYEALTGKTKAERDAAKAQRALATA